MRLSDRILFIDEHAIVLDKPAGLPMGTSFGRGETVVGRLAELPSGSDSSPVPLYQLDDGASGCLLLARNAEALADLRLSFQTENVQAYYLAVVDCDVKEEEGKIAVPLARRPTEGDAWRMVADPKGEPAVTKWSRMEGRNGRTLIRFEPLTWRPHQIRAHIREAFGAGIVGDPLYGTADGPMLLHANRISVARGDSWHFHIDALAPLPEHFSEWQIDPEAVERDKQRLKQQFTYRNWDHDYWDVLASNLDGALFDEVGRAGYPAMGVADNFLEECYYEKGALEPLASYFGRRHYPAHADFKRFLPKLVEAGREDLMEKVWTSVTRRSRANYFVSRDELGKKLALDAYQDAVEWLDRIGSHQLAKQMAEAANDLSEGRFPGLPPVSDLRKMDERVFWDLISRTRAHAETTDEQIAVLDELLRTFSAGDIKKFAVLYGKYMRQLYHWNVWALAYAARDGCSDDAFMEFRSWLILQGDPELLDRAIKDPASAAKQVARNPELPEGTLLPTIDEAYLARAKSTFEWPMIDLEKPKGREWPEDQLEGRFPDLVRHYEG